MGAFFLMFILPQLIAWFLAWKGILNPVSIIVFILAVIYWKASGGYIDMLIISSEMAFIGFMYEVIKSA